MSPLIDIQAVRVPKDRLRPLGDVKQLAESIAEVGLLQPITVTKDLRLVTGRHRLEACKLLGHKTIAAHVVDLDGLRAELAEIDENLIRNELTTLERGEHISRRNEILLALGLRAKVGQGRPSKNGETISPLKSTAQIAREMGVSERVAQQDRQIAERIAPDVKERIRATPLADSKVELLELARMPHEKQRDIVKQIESGSAKNVMVAKMTGVSSDPDYDGDAWGTPPAVLGLVRTMLGEIDLDPASNDHAQKTVRAVQYFTKQVDGLKQKWCGRVFCNPPYSSPLIAEFTKKLMAEYDAKNITEALYLVNNCTDTTWCQALLTRFPACFTRGRVAFVNQSGQAFATRQGQVVFYLGRRSDAFTKIFSALGCVVRP